MLNKVLTIINMSISYLRTIFTKYHCFKSVSIDNRNIKINLSDKEINNQKLRWDIYNRSKILFSIGQPTSKKDIFYDPITNRIFKKFPYFFFRPHRINVNTDIKYSWDLCRGYEFIMFSLHSTPELIKSISSYRTNFFTGIEWSSPMEVSIRVINLLVALRLNSSFFTGNKKIVRRFIIDHYAYLINNLEKSKYGHTNNHYLSNIIALHLLAEHLQLDTFFTKNEISNELRKQFHDDGSNFEGSTHYHFLSTEMIFWLKMLSRELSSCECLNTTLDKALSVCHVLLRSDGTIPLVGDCDSGIVTNLYVFFSPDQGNDNDKREALDDYYSRFCFFSRNYQVQTCGRISNITINKDSNNDISIFEYNRKTKLSKTIDLSDYRVFYYSGLSLVVFDSSTVQITFKVGSLGQEGRGGHDHNDQLSMTIWSYELGTILHDPGTFTYSQFNIKYPDLRRSKYHNSHIDFRQEEFDSLPFKSSHPGSKFMFRSDLNWVGIQKYSNFSIAREVRISHDAIIIVDYFESLNDFNSHCLDLNDLPFANFYGFSNEKNITLT
ncbi:hypothetical protein VCHA37P191_60168 [Vibrio chagasii]|nr:hypothetical protein VCHA37P191_60168 [Vibrio chagasii]